MKNYSCEKYSQLHSITSIKSTNEYGSRNHTAQCLSILPPIYHPMPMNLYKRHAMTYHCQFLQTRNTAFYIQNGGRLPSRICDHTAHHRQYLVVFITVQNLVGIDAVVVLTFDNMEDLIVCELGLKCPLTS